MKKLTIGKKELKNFVNENGFFYSMKIDVKKNAPEGIADRIPEGAMYFEGVVSNGELNRNGYIIRPQALMDSLSTYMLNPVILLQHDMEQPIGTCLTAQAINGSVAVTGYVYDDLTGGRFGRNLFRGLSTGAIPHEYEFENSKTGQVISEEEFMKFNWDEQMSGDWITCVTKLDWVEFSVVGIGSVKKALVTSKNAIEAFLSNKKFCENTVKELAEKNKVDDEEENDGEEKEVAGEEQTEGQSKDVVEPTEQGESSENSGEKPEATAEDTVEKDGEGEGEQAEKPVEENKIRISKADRQALQDAADLFAKTLAATIADEEEEEKSEAKPEGEEKKEEEEKPVEKPADESKAEEAKEGEGEVETNSVAKAFELPGDLKDAIQFLVDSNVALEKQVQQLKLELSKVPHKKGLSITSQFNNNSPKEEPKPTAASRMAEWLKANGVAIK